ncbi:MAG TPA: C4-type zinc ribbon domain-containing protein [Actinomycetota bacterium]|nr:C4-type zinc ribbon domain-containing protein [Actinomycetota bacterium]
MDRLLELQELDRSVDRLEARRRDLESGEEVEERRRDLQQVEERLGELRLALDSVVREQGRLEAEAASLDAKITAEERRLYDGSVANPKELESIQAEVKNLRDRKRRVEDTALDQMERREDMEGRLPGLEGEVAELRERLAELERASTRELQEIGTAVESRRAEREGLVTEFDEELLELYEDLRAQKKGVGAAALRDGVCQGCHQKLSALELDRIKRTDGIRRCEYCRRILILE